MRFFDWMRGIFTRDPRMDDETIKMPLVTKRESVRKDLVDGDLPSSSEDGEAHSEGDSDVLPGEGTDAVEDVFPSGVLAGDADWREHGGGVHNYLIIRFI
jgi:hypothetical protein